jgi:hypothetical protein
MKCPRCQQENPSQAKFCLARAGFAIEHVSPVPTARRTGRTTRANSFS